MIDDVKTVIFDFDPSLDNSGIAQILGIADQHIRMVEKNLGADIHVRGSRVTITGEQKAVDQVQRVLHELQSLVRRGHGLSVDIVRRTIDLVAEDSTAAMSDTLGAGITVHRGKTVRPSTPGQRDYLDAIDNNTIVFGVGPAGSGKTYLAMAKAVQALKRRDVRRIILTRPAVEAGENLGFLPGTLSDKIDPYLRPLYDALRDMVEPESIPKLIEAGIIEVAPLAYMRGRTLNDAFVILDEAQNTTPAQMKMFLTRLGFGTKMVITGDLTQVDLPSKQESGLRRALSILDGVRDTAIIELHADDVVRHGLVSAIVEAYDAYEHAVRSEEKPYSRFSWDGARK